MIKKPIKKKDRKKSIFLNIIFCWLNMYRDHTKKGNIKKMPSLFVKIIKPKIKPVTKNNIQFFFLRVIQVRVIISNTKKVYVEADKIITENLIKRGWNTTNKAAINATFLL